MTVSDMSLDESGSNFAKVVATSLLLDVTRGSSEAYYENNTTRAALVHKPEDKLNEERFYVIAAAK